MPMKELEIKIEKPILERLKCSGNICERVRSQKEHFWVKEENVHKFIELVKSLIGPYEEG